MFNLITTAVAIARTQSTPLKKENYWLYVKKDGSHSFARDNEKKTEGYIGYFVEDDTRLSGIAEVAEKKIKRLKHE